MVDSKEETKISEKILIANFNQDGSCFAVGTETGFKVFNSYPYRDNFERNLDGGIGIVEMLERCNIMALVGGGKNPKFTTNKVIIWDDHLSKVVSELRFTSIVRNVKLKKDKLIVVCDNKIYVFDLLNFQNIDTIVCNGTKGLIALSIDPQVNVIGYPDAKQGSVKVKFYEKDALITINAHESAVASLSLNYDGSLLATASDKGTLIRIFNSQTTQMLQEVRRGSEKALIFSISFNISSTLIATCSDRGTIHIFSLSGVHKKLKEGGEV